MTDVFDRAQEREMEDREAAIAHAREHAPHGISRMFCQDCDEPIPQARREASPGCTRCLDCQQEHELELAMRARR